jgi:hypothetical protein
VNNRGKMKFCRKRFLHFRRVVQPKLSQAYIKAMAFIRFDGNKVFTFIFI